MAVTVMLKLLLVGYGVLASASFSSSTNQPYRTGFHFQPPKNWMNDPNGPMYYNGVYHLFFQYNPYAAVWGNITWAHSVSYDLVNWVHIDDAIYPSEPYDIKGCWSGSATVLPGGKPAILYTGGDSDDRQVQNLAVAENVSDPFLRSWIKSKRNPVMTPDDGIDPKNFRDPSTAWLGHDKVWRVVVGAQINGRATAVLYRSKDFVEWNKSVNPLRSSSNTSMWECPDFYPARVNKMSGVSASLTKHVFKASFNGQDHYILGSYMAESDNYLVQTDFLDNGEDFRYDYGNFYASKAFFDGSKNRQVLWAWVTESDSQSDDIEKGWAGLQSIPRTVFLSETGEQLLVNPVPEIEQLRTKNVGFHNEKLEPGSVREISDITASQADVKVEFDLPNLKEAELMNKSWSDPQRLCSEKTAVSKGKVGPFGLLVLATGDLKEQTAIYFHIFRSDKGYNVLMCSDQSRSSFRDETNKISYGAFINIDPTKEKLSLRTLIDRSIVESFAAEGKACITARVYPKYAIDDQAHLFAFNNGTTSIQVSSLAAWSMKNARFVSSRREENNK